MIAFSLSPSDSRIQRYPARAVAHALLIATVATTSVATAQSYWGPADRPPKIAQQPTNTSVEQGQTATLRFAVEEKNDLYAYPTITFQWLKDGTRLTGATQATFTLAHAQPSDAGSYQVVASNRLGWVASTPVTLTVVTTYLPLILLPPASLVRTEGQTATFEINATGAPSMTYQWRKNGVSLPGATAAKLVLANARVSDAGSYDALVTNSRGTVLTRAATLTIIAPPPLLPPESAVGATPPPPRPAELTIATTPSTRIIVQPQGATIGPGGSAAFAVTAAGENLSFQWRKDGVDLPGATIPAYAVTGATAADMGFYSVVVGGNGSTIESDVAILTVAAASGSRLVNLSTRGFVPAGEALTTGFSWRGSGSKNLLVRAVGPVLTRFGVAGVLADPRLEIIPAGALAAAYGNDDWGTASHLPEFLLATRAAGAFALEAGSKDAAVLANLDATSPRNHTVRITSAAPGADGVVLAEIYDTDPASSSGRLAAVSTLGYTGPGDRALVPGFTIVGSAPKRLLIRAIGPGLAQFGVTETLPDPRISLRAASQEAAVANNDNWAGDARVAAACAATGAFALAAGSNDAALVVTLPPGGYTVMVSGSGVTRGNVLVEIYDLDP